MLVHPLYQASDKAMILEEATHIEYGYYPRDLKCKSNKDIFARCDLCGIVRIIKKAAYRDLCHSCSIKGWHHTKEAKQKQRAAKLGKNNPMYGRSAEKNPNWKGGLAKSICRYCGAIFEVYPSIKDQSVFCSIECKAKWQSVNMNGKNNHMYGMTGEKSPGWKGGISFGKYCPKFNEEFKEYIRAKFDNVCFLCGKTEEDNGQKLSVHHVNYDKACGCAETEEDRKVDDNACQFVPLCRSCNSRVNKDRDKWELYFKNKLKNKLNGWYI